MNRVRQSESPLPTLFAGERNNRVVSLRKPHADGWGEPKAKPATVNYFVVTRLCHRVQPVFTIIKSADGLFYFISR
jgi:hypothetical protein